MPATFFVVGSQVVRHPGHRARGCTRDGFELGNHTFTHAELARVPAGMRALQVDLTESALGGITGIRPRLVRPPYSATPTRSRRARRALGDAGRRGYIIALADYDPGLESPGVARSSARHARRARAA